MMPGSKIPKLQGDGAASYMYPTEIEMGLTGLTNIEYYGLASYARPALKSNKARQEISRNEQDPEANMPPLSYLRKNSINSTRG